MTNPVPAITSLHQALVAHQHPAAAIIERALEVSNSPEFLLGAARMLRDAAQKDFETEERIIRTLTQQLK
jgi:hypothetical protein